MEVSMKCICLFIVCIQIQKGFGFLSSESSKENPMGLEKIQFYFYTTPYNGKEIRFNNGPSISNLDLKKDCNTVIIVAGFLSTGSTPVLLTLPNAFLNHGSYANVIVMNWESLSGSKPQTDNEDELLGPLSFFRVVSNLKDVGAKLAEFINLLKTQKKIPYRNIHLVGFSLGAHIAGIAGETIIERYGGQIGRITGLDPSITIIPLRGTRLRKGAASFVDIYHTNRGLLGETAVSTGDVNVYVNGGSNQPGCYDQDFSALPKLGSCSHNFAWKFFYATFQNNFLGCPCYNNCFCMTDCYDSCPDSVPVGINAYIGASGSYHVNTRS